MIALDAIFLVVAALIAAALLPDFSWNAQVFRTEQYHNDNSIIRTADL